VGRSKFRANGTNGLPRLAGIWYDAFKRRSLKQVSARKGGGGGYTGIIDKNIFKIICNMPILAVDF
jgi:hypothetical protein